MIKKTISAACAVLLTLASASCQKSDVDLCLDAQTELVETLQKSMTGTARTNTLTKWMTSRTNSSSCMIP